MNLDSILSSMDSSKDLPYLGLVYGGIIAGIGIAFALMYAYAKLREDRYQTLPFRYRIISLLYNL